MASQGFALFLSSLLHLSRIINDISRCDIHCILWYTFNKYSVLMKKRTRWPGWSRTPAVGRKSASSVAAFARTALKRSPYRLLAADSTVREPEAKSLAWAASFAIATDRRKNVGKLLEQDSVEEIYLEKQPRVSLRNIRKSKTEEHQHKAEVRDLLAKIKQVTRNFKIHTLIIEDGQGHIITKKPKVFKRWKNDCQSLFEVKQNYVRE
ncbi:hypothetical protein DBV15_11207 [Temnothorax longispinosus]|uniref:Uncharacterized protein n=1 Tax=Temnothorax longispinosus TaxID=300112 RepID=A0A4S2L759_9HYME|nr:hypothetical protein DBV15_11207 [Temnothorax longispinosus]